MEDERLRNVCFVGVEPRVRGSLRELAITRTPGGNPRGREVCSSCIGRTPEAGEYEPPDAFLTWLFAKAGLATTAYRSSALRRRLPACLRALRTSSAEAARTLLEQRPEAIPVAVEAVLIGVSGFFRDSSVFDHLHRSVLPELLNARQGLRIFSAGCSDGQELYSVAMLLSVLGALQGSDLMGMDCRPEAIARAKAGWFPANELEGMAPKFRDSYFRLDGARARIAPSLSETVCWRVGDLLAANPAGRLWDVILFRNVAIYLRPEQTQIWESLADQLSPGGFLVTGKAERPPVGLPLGRVSSCIYRRLKS